MSSVSRRQFLSSALAMPCLAYAPQGRPAIDRLGASAACLADLPLLDAIGQIERLGFGTLEMIAYTGARHSVGDIPGFAYHEAPPAERDAVFEATRGFRHISAHLSFEDVRLFGDAAERRAGLVRLQRAIDIETMQPDRCATSPSSSPPPGIRASGP